VRRPTPRHRELRAAMREAITRELQALYRAQQDEPLPERLTNLLRQLDSRKAGPDQAGSASEKSTPSTKGGGNQTA
jgi:hypothetical protein